MSGARIQLKRATASSWSSNNPVLYVGEIGYETDTNKFKIGDGTTAYNSLPYFNGNLTGSSLNDLADVTIASAANGDFLRWNGTAWVNDAVNLSTDTIGSYVESLVAGTGVTLTNNSGEAATPTIAIGQSVATTASVTFAHVSASVTGNVIGDLTGNSDTASTLETARIIELSGDVTGSASFDGSSNINISVTSNPDSITLGTDTTGNYVVDLAGGTGVTITHTPGEGSTASVAIGQDVSTTASVTFDQLTVNGQTNVGGDIIPDTTEAYDLGSASARFRDVYLSGTTIDLGGATITSDGTDISFSGGINVGGSANFVGDLTGNADTASELETARAISLSGDLSGSVSFDGSADVTINATIEPNSVALGTDTTGNYVVDVVAGTGLSVSHTQGEGSTASVELNAVLNDLTDVSASAPNGDEYLKWDGSAWVPDVVQLGEHTVGDYMVDVVGGTGVSVSHTLSEGSTATVHIGQDVATTASVTFARVNITGDLLVNGTTTSINTETLLIKDNIITLNSNASATPVSNAGIEVERGTSDNVSLRWNETTDSWEITEDGTTYRNIAAGQDVETSSSVTFAAVTAPVIGNASTASALQTARAISLGGDLSGSVSFDGSTNVTLNATVEPNSVALGTDTTGNYLVDLSGQNGVSITHTPGEGSTASISLVQDINTSSSVTFAHVSADLTGDVTGNSDTASALQTARSISLAGDLSGSVSFDGSTDVTITATVQADSVALGTDTTGNYMTDLVAGTGVTVTHTPGEGSSASVAIGQDVATTASVTFAHVASDVTGDVTGNASTATTLETARAISLAGDLSGSVSFDGSQDVTITATVQPNSVALGTDTTGNYVADVVAGAAITVTHTPAEGSSASIALNASLNDLNDVVVSAPAEFQALAYDGAGWVPTYTPVVSYVRNAEATTIATGTAVYLFGGNGDHASVKRAGNASEATSSKTIGLVGAPIAANQNGPVVTRGYVDGIDLSAYSTGDVLWLGENGQITTTKPQAPLHMVFIGVVVRATINGIVYVAVQNGYELNELHDVKTNGKVDKDVLMWNSASSVWINDQINLGTDTVGNYVNDVVAGTGVTVTHTPGEGSSASIAIGQDVSTSASVVFHTLETTHDLTIGGNFYVSGSIVTENQTSLEIDDPFIYLNGSSSVSNVDLGIAGNYNDGTYRHAGIFRDATDGKFKFFDSYEPEPSSPIDTGHASYSPAPVVAETFESTVTTGSAPFVVASTTEVANLHADTASSLHTARAISLAGDLSGSVSFDGSGDVTLTATVQPNSVALGTDTTGNYMVDLAEGTGVTIIHTPGEGSTASVSIGQSVATTASVTFAHVSADVTGNLTGDVAGNADTASSLETARAISLAGDLSGSVSFDGSGDVTLTATIGANSVALGTDTTGNFVNDIVAGTGVTVTHTPGEGSSASVAIGQDVATTASVTFVHVAADLTGDVTGNVTGDLTGNADTATTLETARAISLGGDLSGSASFDGSADVTITATVQPNSVALGTDTTGNYVNDITAGTGVTVTHTPAEGSSPTIAIGQAVGTSASVQFAQVTTTGNVTIGGDLTVNGTTTTVNTETINLADNQIVLNSNETSAPSQNAGIEIERGTSANVALRWNETSDKWEITENGSTYYDIATTFYVDGQTITSLDEIGDVNITSASAGQFLKWNGTAWVNDSIPTINALDDIGNVNAPTPSNGDFLKYDGSSSAWVSASIPTVNNLDDVGDVTISSAASGQFLKWNGSAWVNDAIDLGTDTTGDYMSGVTAGTGITITHTPGEGSTATITNAGVTSVNGSTGAITGVVTTSDSGTVTSAMIADGTIVNADINTSAAIALSKLASGTSGQIIVANSSGVPTWVSESGDITISDTGVAAISSGVIVNADINSSAAIALTKLASDTTTALGVGSIQLGHETDTTITRVSAGKIAVEGVTVATTTDTRDVLVRFYMEVI